MTDDTSGAGGQVPASSSGTPSTSGQVPTSTNTTQTPPAGAPPTGQVPTPGSATGGDDLTPEQLRDALRKARDEAAKTRVDAKRLAELEKAEAERQAANLTEIEKAARERDAATAALQAMRARIGSAELKVASQAAGIIDPDVAAAMLGSKVEYGDDGEPKNIAKLVEDLKQSKPHLFGANASGTAGAAANGQRASSGGATNPGSGARSGGVFTREQISRMSPQEYAANQQAIFEALKSGQIR